ncbi:lipopolysaccharide biosynthesis protein [Pseudomonas sp. OIL-1]|uniref:lipopolysaccharide biosynthesis protein n=1 Tax=Pseudomonas sp. OIL-1 TaxID=2706126 RepID=UPI0013A72F3E|nr:oligosaccharide flippase family protein [Pseudomonas sp. OIL-1]QIB52619.1 oligosaccharide flippase family protein [Pseudomonas sp. OIL-1]
MNQLLSPIKKLLPKSAFARGVGVLVGGTAGAQVLMVLAAPLLTRLYSPEDFGLLAVYVGLLSLFTVIASLRYELAIPLPKSHTEAANVLVLSLLMVLLMTCIAGLMVMLAGNQLALALDAPGLASYFWLLPIGVLLTGIYNVFNYWAIRTKAFPDIAKTRISQTLATLAVQLLGYKLGGIALLYGQAGGQGVGSFRLARSALKHEEFRSWCWSGVWQAAKRYKQFPMFSTWSGLFNTAGTQLPPLMFAAFFSAGAAGLYALAHRVLAMPMSVLGDAIGKVFFSNAAEAYREGRLAPLVEKVHRKLAEIAMPATLLLVIGAPELFFFVFGESWRQAGEFARWMAPWLYMVFITSPLSTLFSIMERERQGLLFQAGLLSVRVLAVFIGASLFDDLMLTVMLFAAVSALFWIGFLLWVCLASGNPLSAVLRPTLTACTQAILCLLPLGLALHLAPTELSWLMAGIGFSSILLGAYYLNIFRKAHTS